MSHPNLISMNGDVLAAMDTETTGREFGRNEVCQIAIVTLDCHLEPQKTFYTNIRPQYPDRMHPKAVETHGLTVEVLQNAPDKFEVSDMLWDWFQSLGLPPGKRLVPLVHNAQFDIPFVQCMIGAEYFNEVFSYPTRDTQAVAACMKDAAAYQGRTIRIKYANLQHLCEALGVKLDDAHDALADALATARCYKKLLELPTR